MSPTIALLLGLLLLFFGGELLVRGSVALFVFGTISNLDSQIILASVVLWFINVALPALIGLFSLKELKLIFSFIKMNF